VVVKAESMAARHRYFPFGRREEKQVLMLDDNGFGDAVSHGRDSLRQDMFFSMLLLFRRI